MGGREPPHVARKHKQANTSKMTTVCITPLAFSDKTGCPALFRIYAYGACSWGCARRRKNCALWVTTQYLVALGAIVSP